MGYELQFKRTVLQGGNLSGGETVVLMDTTRAGSGSAARFMQGLASKVVVFNAVVDQDSAADGLKLYESIDGENWDLMFSVQVLAAECPRKVYMPVSGEHVKVTYQNGATPTTVTRLNLLRDLYERGGVP